MIHKSQFNLVIFFSGFIIFLYLYLNYLEFIYSSSNSYYMILLLPAAHYVFTMNRSNIFLAVDKPAQNILFSTTDPADDIGSAARFRKKSPVKQRYVY